MTDLQEKQRLELKRIKQERTCPPIEILRQGGEEIEKHLKHCPECRERLKEITSMDILAEKYCSENSLFNHKEGEEYAAPIIYGSFPIPTLEEYYADKLHPVPDLEWYTERIRQLIEEYEAVPIRVQKRSLEEMERLGAKNLDSMYDDIHSHEKEESDSSNGIPFSKIRAVTGEIRMILDQSVPTTYNKYGWHNPPKVVIIETEEETGIPGLVRVSQLHDSDPLADFGDISLEHSRYYAESWNCYPQFLDSLSIPFDHARNDEIAAILNLEKNPLPFTPEENSPCYFFRQTELNIGAFYGSRAAARASNLFEAPYEYSFTVMSRLHPEFAVQLNNDKVRFTRDSQEFALAAAAANSRTTIHILKENGSEEITYGEPYIINPISGFTEIKLPDKGNYSPYAVVIAQTGKNVTATPAAYAEGYCQCKFLTPISEDAHIHIILIELK